MRLNLNEIEYEVERDLEEFDRFERPGRSATARIRASKFSRNRSDSSQRYSSGSGVRSKDSKEDSV